MTRKLWRATIGEGVPLRRMGTNQFAWKLRRYLQERIMGFKVERVAFLLFAGDDALKVHIKKERKREEVIDVFEDIGGPEIRLYVNEFRIATWMLGADRLTTDMLDKHFEEFAQVALLAILGTWELHNTTICCTKWGDDKNSRIKCCDTP